LPNHSARMLKRLRPAPQGRGYRIRKRSNHVTIFVDTIPTGKVDSEELVVNENQN